MKKRHFETEKERIESLKNSWFFKNYSIAELAELLKVDSSLKPQFDLKRPLSWSSLSSFEWNREEWYTSYLLGIRSQSKEMDYGKVVDLRIQNDPKFLPTLPRYALMQYKMVIDFAGIPLIGLPDGLDLDSHLLADYKTGKKVWDQKRADETGQLTMYLLLLFITHKIPPEKFRCFIHWLPTQENGDFTISFAQPVVPVRIQTRRTMVDILNFGARINRVYAEMETYGMGHN